MKTKTMEERFFIRNLLEKQLLTERNNLLLLNDLLKVIDLTIEQRVLFTRIIDGIKQSIIVNEKMIELYEVNIRKK